MVLTEIPVDQPVLVAQILLAKIQPQPPLLPPPVTLQRPPVVSAVMPAFVTARPNASIIVSSAAPRPPAPATPQKQVRATQPSLPSNYLGRLLAHLNAYKHYPYDARRRHEQGVVRLHFIMNRSGLVRSYEIVGSSGFPDLDEAARQLMRDAQPLPQVPPDYPGDILDLVVPIVFSLK